MGAIRLGAAVAAGWLVLGWSGPGLAQLQDSYFDGQPANVADFCYLDNNCPGGPWTGGGGGGFVRQSMPSWGSPAAVTPAHMVLVQGQGWVRQAFTAPETRMYRLGWWQAGRPANGQVFGGNQNYRVYIDAIQLGEYATSSGAAFCYRSATVFLTAGQAYTLSIYGQATSDQTVFLDGMALAPVTTDQRFGYDALGRLAQTKRWGGTEGHKLVVIGTDPADNRSNYAVSGVDQCR